MKASFKTKLTSLVAAWAMLVAPVMPAYAQTATATSTPSGPLDFNTYCSPAVLSAVSSSAGDQTKAYCTQASIAQTAIKFQTAKEILMMVSGATLTALAFVPFGAGEVHCKTVAYSSDAAGLGIDVAEAIKTSSLSTAMISGISSIGAIAIQAGIKNTLFDGATKAIDKGFIGNHSSNAECLTSAALAFAQGAISMLSVSMQKKAEQSALSSAASLEVSAAGTSNFNLTGNTPVTSGSSGTAANAVAAAPTTTTGTCAGTGSGSAYLSCLSKGDPVSEALTANPDAMNAMDQALGQPTGAFIQGYKGDGSPASVAGAIGAAMGMSPTGIAALQKTMDTAAEIASKDDYKPATYAANNAPAASAAGDVDFGKMMNGMMSKLAPDATKGEDPSTIVYRQLDLLPASKIEANKDISIFARIGYRYRKASSELEQLNWANPANQTVSNTPIGGVTTTPTTTANSNTRTPASKN